MGEALPKCNITRDSDKKFCYNRWAGSGPGFGLSPARRLIGIRMQLTDTGHRVKHAGERAWQVAVSPNAGLKSEGTRHGQAEEGSAEGEGICFREGRFRRVSDPWCGAGDRHRGEEIAGHKLELF